MVRSEEQSRKLSQRQKKREVLCAVHLREKLERRVLRRDEAGFEEQMRLEAVDLVSATFGPELLVALGEMYQLRANLYLADELVGRYSLRKRMASVQNATQFVR